MVIGKKFWKIKKTDTRASYAPHENVGITISGKVIGERNAVLIDERSKKRLTMLQEMMANTQAGIGVAGQMVPSNTVIDKLEGDIVWFSKGINCISNDIQITVTAWNLDFPSVNSNDMPITALLCLDSNHEELHFLDDSSRKVVIPAGTLVKGAIYYFQVSAFLSVGSDDFIGFSAG